MLEQIGRFGLGPKDFFKGIENRVFLRATKVNPYDTCYKTLPPHILVGSRGCPKLYFDNYANLINAMHLIYYDYHLSLANLY